MQGNMVQGVVDLQLPRLLCVMEAAPEGRVSRWRRYDHCLRLWAKESGISRDRAQKRILA
jgi:hypothetical protein